MTNCGVSKNVSWEPIQESENDRLNFDVCRQEWSTFVQQFEIGNIPFRGFVKVHRSLGMKWHLIVLGGSSDQEVFLEIDFHEMCIKLNPDNEDCNAYLKIGSDLLLKLLKSEELLSIAMQSDRIEIGGRQSELAYRSLDVLWYMGLDDKSRLQSYVSLQSNSKLSSKIAEIWV